MPPQPRPISSAAGAPALVRKRVWHTWLAAGPLLLAIALTVSAWEPERPLHELLDWGGYFLIGVCVLGRTWCGAYIGGRKKAELVTIGPFSVVRNPLYVFSFLGALGVGLCTAEITLALLIAGLFAAYYRVVVAREEAYLTAAFGAAYRNYAARVPRWIPDFSLWRDRSEIAVKPHFFFRTLRDSAVFLIALPALEFVEYLHASHLLPWLVRLP